MADKVNVAVIYGSVRERRLGTHVGEWVRTRLERHAEFTVDAIDPQNLRLGDLLHQTGDTAEKLRQRIALADAYLMIVPEYNHGYPAVLKAVIDAAYSEWNAKPVAFVSYGGQAGGIRAIEQLRQVFAELHVTTIRDCVAFVNAWEQFGPTRQLRSPEQAEKALELVLAQLHWWATALRTARRAKPYEEVTA